MSCRKNPDIWNMYFRDNKSHLVANSRNNANLWHLKSSQRNEASYESDLSCSVSSLYAPQMNALCSNQRNQKQPSESGVSSLPGETQHVCCVWSSETRSNQVNRVFRVSQGEINISVLSETRIKCFEFPWGDATRLLCSKQRNKKQASESSFPGEDATRLLCSKLRNKKHPSESGVRASPGEMQHVLVARQPPPAGPGESESR